MPACLPACARLSVPPDHRPIPMHAHVTSPSADPAGTVPAPSLPGPLSCSRGKAFGALYLTSAIGGMLGEPLEASLLAADACKMRKRSTGTGLPPTAPLSQARSLRQTWATCTRGACRAGGLPSLQVGLRNNALSGGVRSLASGPYRRHRRLRHAFHACFGAL